MTCALKLTHLVIDADYVALLSHLFQPDPTSKLPQETQVTIYPAFVSLVYDTFSKHLSSADTLQELARLTSGDLWATLQRLIIARKSPVLSRSSSLAYNAKIKPDKHHDLSRLMGDLRPVINKEQERLGQLVSAKLSVDDTQDGEENAPLDVFMTPTKRKRPKDAISKNLRLSISASFLLIAAYLASYNHARTDVRMFAVEAEERLNGSPSKSKKNGSPSKRRKGSPRKNAPNKIVCLFLDCIEQRKMCADHSTNTVCVS